MESLWFHMCMGLIVIECLTVWVFAIWFAGGSAVAMLLAMAGYSKDWQVLAFIGISSLVIFRRMVKKWMLKTPKRLR